MEIWGLLSCSAASAAICNSLIFPCSHGVHKPGSHLPARAGRHANHGHAQTSNTECFVKRHHCFLDCALSVV